MTRISVRLNHAGVRRVMSTPRARQVIEEKAARVRDACNAQSSWGGYESGLESQNWRASANVWTVDLRATNDEARYNRLIRNADAAR